MDETVGLAAAARFVSERYGTDAGASVLPLGSGDWSRAFSFRLREQDLVVRFGKHQEDFLKDQKVMSYSRPELPVPAVLEVGEGMGGFYAISERYFGVFLETLDEQGWRILLPALLRTLDALREVEFKGGIVWSEEAEESGAPPLGWQQWLVASLEDQPGKRVSGWRTQLQERPEIEEVFASGERALRSLLPVCPETRHLLHRDLLNRNVLVAPDASQVVAAFDWGCSLAGDFLYEVAWLTFWAPWYPALQALDFRQVIHEHYQRTNLVVEHFDERLRCYELHIGLEHIAYAAFTRREEHLDSITSRTRELLDSLPF